MLLLEKLGIFEKLDRLLDGNVAFEPLDGLDGNELKMFDTKELLFMLCFETFDLAPVMNELRVMDVSSFGLTILLAKLLEVISPPYVGWSAALAPGGVSCSSNGRFTPRIFAP